MVITFPPPITKLLDTANDLYQKRGTEEDLKKALFNAREFTSAARGYFIFFSKTRVEDEEVNKLVELILDNYKNLDEQFDKIYKFLDTKDTKTLFDGVLGIQEYSFKIQNCNTKLKEINEQLKLFAPFPEVDDFIKLSANVINGVVEKNVISERLPLLVRLKVQLQEGLNKFKERFPEAEELINNVQEALSYFEEGIGAIYSYTVADDKKDLLNGLNILRVNSWDIIDAVNKTREYSKDKKYSFDSNMDEFIYFSLKFMKDEINGEKFKEILTAFKDYIRMSLEETNTIEDNVIIRSYVKQEFLPSIEKHKEDITGFITKLEDLLSKEKPEKEEIGKTIKELHNKFEEFLKTRDEFFKKASEEKDLSEDNEIMELRDIIKSLYTGVTPISVLQECLNKLNTSHEKRLERIKKLLSVREDEKLRAFEKALEARKQVYMELDGALSDRDGEHLVKALEMAENSYDSLIGIDEELAEREVDKSSVICIKCGFSNPRRNRKCGRCNFMLPYTEDIDTEQSSMEITDDGKSVTPVQQEQPQVEQENDVKKLKGLTENVLQGLTDANELEKFLQGLINKLSTGKKEFTKFAKPFMEKYQDPEFNEKANELGAIFENIEKVLNYMNKYFTESRNDEFLQNGLAHFMDQAEKLESFQRNIQDVLKKRKPDA